MKKYILYAHSGSENHGCEALVRSTCDVLKTSKEQVILISRHPDEDLRYGVDERCRILKRGEGVSARRIGLDFWKAYFCLKLFNDHKPLDDLSMRTAAGVKPRDIALLIGGDSYCYDTDVTDLINDHELWSTGGLKNVYWGCSIEPELLEDPSIADDIRKYDLITARESISFDALKKINSNTVLTIDSAFCLGSKAVDLPENFIIGNTVGINVSPLTIGCGRIKDIVLDNYKCLIHYLLENTDMNICLIPHVIKSHDDDRKPLSELFSMFNETNRVCMVEDHTAEQLKWIISQCRFFIGTRTHSTIAAYSTCVPTLVVGYSVKSRGIARDLFGSEEQYVLSAQEMCHSDDLLRHFKFFLENEQQIKQHLVSLMPSYLQKINIGVQALEKL